MEINASSHDQGPTAASGLRICEEASVDSRECNVKNLLLVLEICDVSKWIQSCYVLRGGMDMRCFWKYLKFDGICISTRLHHWGRINELQVFLYCLGDS